MVQQTIAIAGAEENVGSEIAKRLIRLDQYRVLVLSEDEDQLRRLRDQLRIKENGNSELINCLKDGCWEADIILLEVPRASLPELTEKIKEVSTQKIVFVISGDGQETEGNGRVMEEWERYLPNSKLVIASNSPGRTGMLLAGREEESLITISDILKKLGFEPAIKIKK